MGVWVSVCLWDEVRVYRCGCMSGVGDIMTLELTIVQALFKGAMTWHTHTIRVPSCTVSLGPRAKQETKAYTLLRPWGCILDRHIAMVSVFRSLAFCDSLRRICTQDSALCDPPERRYRLPLHAPFI